MPTKSERREDAPGGASPAAAGAPPKRQRVGGRTPSPAAGASPAGRGGDGPAGPRCAGCGASGDGTAPLLLFDDPDERDRGEAGAGDGRAGREERRYCPKCMTSKKVRVFWPVDSRWYVATVVEHDPDTGEHLLRYPDGDTEWVRIGEDHTTNNAQYKEYSRQQSAASGGGTGLVTSPTTLSRLPSAALSFALTQSFGFGDEIREPPRDGGGCDADGDGDGGPSQQQRLFQQLNLDRTASSMSSFGMYGGGGGTHAGGPAPPAGGREGGEGGGFELLHYAGSFGAPTDYGPYGPPPPVDDGRYHGGERGGGGATYVSPGAGGGGGSPRGEAPGSSDPPRGGGGGGHPHWPPHYGERAYYDYHGQAPPPYPPHHRGTYGAPQPPPPKPVPAKSSGGRAAPKPSTPGSKPGKAGRILSPGVADRKDKKALAKAWKKTEDEYLLDLVLSMKHPLKWSIIASNLSNYTASLPGQNMPVRTGKQCRERYVNHLNPRLKHSEFTPSEDAGIWRLFATIGTQWAKMSKVVPGRTDNNLKNRFHNLKRQLVREEETRAKAPSYRTLGSLIHVDRVRDVPAELRAKIEDMWDVRGNIGVIAAGTVRMAESMKNEEMAMRARKFGPFVSVGRVPDDGGEGDGPASASAAGPVQCPRCGLHAPSAQTGSEICTRTGWCVSCTRVGMHLGGAVLRECVNLRRCQEDVGGEAAAEVEELLGEIWRLEEPNEVDAV